MNKKLLEMADRLQRLNIYDGDVLLLKGSYPDHFVKAFSENLKQLGAERLVLILIPPGCELETLNEEDLRQAGLCRINRGGAGQISEADTADTTA